MWLVHHGVPFEVAFRVDAKTFRLDDLTRAALCIVCSEFEGRRFNFNRMQFEEDR
jgi:hypothetical protein